jgi:hypothetical protein
LKPSAPILLFDLQHDLGEKTDLAAQQPELVARAAVVMREAHVDNEFWKAPAP